MPSGVILTDEQRAFAAAARTATLATIGSGGRPRLVPICFAFGADAPDGRARIYSPLDEKPKRSADPRDLARVRDLLILPEATILIDRWSENWSELGWLRLDARAELLEPEPHEVAEHVAAAAALRDRYRQYESHHLEERPIIRFTVDRAVSWGDLEVR